MCEPAALHNHLVHEAWRYGTLIRILDIETESIEYLGKKASPYCADNYVVMPGWQDFQWDGTPIDPRRRCSTS